MTHSFYDIDVTQFMCKLEIDMVDIISVVTNRIYVMQ